MKLIIFILFIYNTFYLGANDVNPGYEALYNYHVKRGFDEINNNYQFNKAGEYLDKILLNNELMQEEKIEILERKKVIKERISNFSNLKSNYFPLGPIISKSYETHHKYEPAYKTAIEASMEEAKEILRQISIREGQTTVLILHDDSVSLNAEEVVLRKLEGIPYYNPLSRENLLDIFKKNITLEDIKNNPSILKEFFKNEPWDMLIVLNISNLLGYDDLNSESFYDISLYKYYIREPDRIIQIGTMSTTGIRTGDYYKRATRDTFFIYQIIFLSIIISLSFVFQNKAIKKDFKNRFWKFKEQLEIFEYLKGVGISILFVGLGIGFCYGIGLGSEKILGSWSEHIGALQLQSMVILIALFLIINPVLLLILTKITDYISLVKKDYYLPILLASFYSGMAIYMHFFYELYDSIFPGSNHILSIYLMSLATVINGFVTGETYKELIDLNSKKALYTIKVIQNNDTQILKTNPLVYKKFIIYFFLIFLTALIGVSSLYSFFKASSTSSLFIFALLILVSIILLYIKLYQKLDVSETIYHIPNVQNEPPTNINNLKSLLLEPDKIPYIYERNVNIENIINNINICFDKEGDTIAFHGGKWSGKNRLIREILNDPRFAGRTEFKVDCGGGENLLPFIEGMKSLPQIQSIMENLKFGKGAKKAAGLLSTVFSFIPVAGGLISKFLDSDVDFTGKENEKFLEKTLIETVHKLSIEIKEFKADETKNRDQLIFILDNFQSINDKMFQLIEKIRLLIKDPIASPEENKIAFILLINTDYRTDLFERYEYSSVIPRDTEFNYYLEGFSIDMAYDYFHKILNFGKTRKNDDLLEKIIEIYGEKNQKDEYRLFPKYLTETLLHEINFISQNYDQFIYTGNPLQISITPSIYFEYNKKLDLLRPVEIKILESASIFGNIFNIKEVSFVLGMDALVLLEEIRQLEKEEEIIVRITSDGDFKFRKGVYREAFRRRIVNQISTDGRKEVPFQIFIEYCNRATDYFSSRKFLTLNEKERYANISKYSSIEKFEYSLRANLDYSRDVFKIPEFQIKGITSLEVIIERIVQSKEIENHKDKSITEILYQYGLIKEFIRIFSFYFNDFQEYIPMNFPYLNEFLKDLINKENFFYNIKDPSLLNDLTLIYFFIDPYDPKIVGLSKKFNKNSLEFNSEMIERLWSEFWEAFFLKIDGNINFRDNKATSEECYKKSIDLSLSILKRTDLIIDEYWKKNLTSRLTNTLAECYQRLYLLHPSSEEFFNESEKYCSTTIQFKSEIKDFTGMAMSYNIRSGLYSQKEDGYNQAKSDLEECRKLNEKMKNYKGLYFTYLGLSGLDKKFNIKNSIFDGEAVKIKNINNFK